MAQTVTPYLLYEDAGAALEWLAGAFGFRESMRMAAPDGRVAHAEMDVGEGGKVMLGAPAGDFRSPRSSGERTALLYVVVDDVDAHCAHAREAGATIKDEPEDQEYGERRYAAEDLEGQLWYFAAPVRRDQATEPSAAVTG
jgi:uncharacterized glyoxalase superfamily protein PhnB